MENWKWIPGYEGQYKVSDLGRVKSFCKNPDGRLLKPGTMNKFGHQSVSLLARNSQCVHVLVMLAFVGPRPEKHDVAHTNGIGSDNRLSNLRYVTRTENNRDITRLGRRKLTMAQAEEIRAAKIPGKWTETANQLSKKYGVNTRLIQAIWSRQLYNHE